MASKLVSQPQYELEREGFGNTVITETSLEPLTLRNSVQFAANRNAVLQSLQEAVAFRLEANGQDHANYCQATRTGAVYFRSGEQICVAIDDAPYSAQNILIARVQEGFDARGLRVPMNDRQLKKLLTRAEKTGRIHPVSGNLELAVSQDGESDFGRNGLVQAFLGVVAEPYSAFLKQNGFDKGYIWTPSQSYFSSKLNNESALVLPCGLGGIGNGDIDYIDAHSNVVKDCGFARGVSGARGFSKIKSTGVVVAK